MAKSQENGITILLGLEGEPFDTGIVSSGSC